MNQTIRVIMKREQGTGGSNMGVRNKVYVFSNVWNLYLTIYAHI